MLPLLFILVLYPLKWLLQNMQYPQKYFSKMPVQKCDYWTLGEGGYKKYFLENGCTKVWFLDIRWKDKNLGSKSQKSVEYRVKIIFLKNGYIFWIFLLYPLRKGVQDLFFVPIQVRENLESGLQNRIFLLYPMRDYFFKMVLKIDFSCSTHWGDKNYVERGC